LYERTTNPCEPRLWMYPQLKMGVIADRDFGIDKRERAMHLEMMRTLHCLHEKQKCTDRRSRWISFPIHPSILCTWSHTPCHAAGPGGISDPASQNSPKNAYSSSSNKSSFVQSKGAMAVAFQSIIVNRHRVVIELGKFPNAVK
jgi:hypothetical protein